MKGQVESDIWTVLFAIERRLADPSPLRPDAEPIDAAAAVVASILTNKASRNAASSEERSVAGSQPPTR
jgi:hypothetical protein